LANGGSLANGQTTQTRERAKKIQEAISVRIEDRSFERLRGTFDEIEVEGGGWWWWWWWDRTDRIIDVGQRGIQ